MFDSVFSERELNDIINFVPPESSDPQAEIAAKLRHFYLHWAMKEAYVKLTGEALLASWLKRLEFFNVRTPRYANELEFESEYGEAICDLEIYLNSERVRDVKLEVQAFRDGFLAIAASDPSIDFLPYTFLTLEELSPT